MWKISINGFGRIGKSIFLQLFLDPSNHYCQVVDINAIHLKPEHFENYLKYDSVHHYKKDFSIIALSENSFEIKCDRLKRKWVIHTFSEKDASKINWSGNLLYEATGAYLTYDKLKTHNIENILITAPAKDSSIPTFIYGVNHLLYESVHKIFSNASCTTNCIAPILEYINQENKIKNAVFTTIHASTASQSILDNPEYNSKSSRSSRSIFNNLIPATTGASSAIKAVIPELENKVYGLAIRVPTNNVSMVDVVITCEKQINYKELCKKIEHDKNIKDIIYVEKNELVSSDFITTTHPTIIDKNASLQINENTIKLIIWYDNEWSYASQCIRMGKYIQTYSENKEIYPFLQENYSLKNKNILLRVDFNVPMIYKEFDNHTLKYEIKDDFRIKSIIPTLERIIRDKPARIVIATHLGRPKSGVYDEKYSTKHLIECIKKYVNKEVHFLEKGIDEETLEFLKEKDNKFYEYTINEIDEDIDEDMITRNTEIYLLENVRFHKDETNFEKPDFNKNDSETYKIWNQLGNIFINSAFGCAHRNHLTINGFENKKNIYYDYLIKNELKALNEISRNPENKDILIILGGSKIDDKLPLCDALKEKVNNIFLGGGIINSYLYNEIHKKYIESLGTKACVAVDGITKVENDKPIYYDIGEKSLEMLYKKIDENEIIFWNGTMGMSEKSEYENGSKKLLEYLMLQKNKRIIIGGGDTASFVLNSGIYKEMPNIHICTGGGASLEYIVENNLVGLHKI